MYGLELISTGKAIMIPKLKGDRLIADAGNDAFTMGVMKEFEQLRGNDKNRVATSKTFVHVYRMIIDGTFQLFLGRNFDKFFTQEQIIYFVIKHEEWLVRTGRGSVVSNNTYFPLKAKGERLIVEVKVSARYESMRMASYYNFNESSCWEALDQHRFVIPC